MSFIFYIIPLHVACFQLYAYLLHLLSKANDTLFLTHFLCRCIAPRNPLLSQNIYVSPSTPAPWPTLHHLSQPTDTAANIRLIRRARLLCFQLLEYENLSAMSAYLLIYFAYIHVSK